MAERLSRLLDGLIEGRDLTAEEAGELLAALTEPATPGPLAGALLAALRAKGETAEEIRGLAVRSRQAPADPAPSSPLARFERSLHIDYEKWHDGIGYDLDDAVWDYAGACAPITLNSRIAGCRLAIRRSWIEKGGKFF